MKVRFHSHEKAQTLARLIMERLISSGCIRVKDRSRAQRIVAGVIAEGLKRHAEAVLQVEEKLKQQGHADVHQKEQTFKKLYADAVKDY